MRGSKHIRAMLLAVLCMAVLASCGADDGRGAPSQQQEVSEVLQEQTQAADQGSQGATLDASSGGAAGHSFVPDTEPAFASPDIDLTAMSSDMVYATVNDMMINPTSYEGKTVRMAGPYYHTYYEETATDYFYVTIKDATACCSQGIEFVWGDGSRSYPQDYPEDGLEVVVTGQFETYLEGSIMYVHLVGASLQTG